MSMQPSEQREVPSKGGTFLLSLSDQSAGFSLLSAMDLQWNLNYGSPQAATPAG